MLRITADYDLNNDEEVYRNQTIDEYDISACTTAGSRDGKTKKLNEDAFSIVSDNGVLFVCVFDGDSSVKSIEALSTISGARFSSHNLCTIFNSMVNKKHSTTELMNKLNSKIHSIVFKFKGTDFSDVHTLPGSSVTLIKFDLKKNKGEFASLGDTFAILFYKNDDSRLVTKDRLKKFDDETFDAIKEIAKSKKITNREAKQDDRIKRMIIDRYQDRINSQDGRGYGILNGQPEALSYIQQGEFSLDELSSILIGTDGVVPLLWDPENQSDHKFFLQAIEKGGLAELIKLKKVLEDSDPNYNKFVRYKHSDDATAIYVKLIQ